MENPKKTQMDDVTALLAAFAQFEKRHPRETRPEWLKRCMMESYSKDKQGRFIVSFTLTPRIPLEPNEHWEEINGERKLVLLDPITGKKLVVLHRSPREVITIFEAVVDPETSEVTVLVDRDLSSIKGEELEGFEVH
jgi:hypothetical protein